MADTTEHPPLADADRHTVGDLYALVRGYFPDATDEACRVLLWSCTAFPMAGRDFTHYRRQLGRYKATVEAGETPCQLCSRPARVNVDTYAPWCWRCHNLMAVRPA